MEIHVARDGSALGVFSPDEVRAGLTEGRFRGSDLAWRAGMGAWTPLADWPEFGSVTPFAKVAEAGVAGIEWERRPSLGSLLRDIWMTIARPAELAGARLEFGRSLGGAYLALLVGLLPFLALVLVNQQVEPLQQETIVTLVDSLNPDLAADIRDGFEAEANDPDAPGPLAMLCGVTCVLAVLPLFSALLGLVQWPFLRLLGVRALVERAVSAEMLSFTWLFVAFLPVSLLVSALGFASPGGSLLIGLFLQLAFLLIQVRALGCALSCGFWRAFGAKFLLFLAFCACCCCVSLLFGFAGALAQS